MDLPDGAWVYNRIGKRENSQSRLMLMALMGSAAVKRGSSSRKATPSAGSFNLGSDLWESQNGPHANVNTHSRCASSLLID
ncbi:hypothetical protein PG990_000231 [Apiospora arundinis]|uniref:Uncharacterized protein n=1 Tax=Apiospora arundinis TaxID=335852 RepID=A0ABR2HZ55_9PEZI